MGRRNRCAFRDREESENEQDEASEDEDDQPKTRSKRLRKGKEADKAANVKKELKSKAGKGKGKTSAAPGSAAQAGGIHAEATAAELQEYEQQVNFYIAEGDTIPAPTKISTEELEKILREVMRLMLFKQHSKPDQPLRREEVTEAINRTTSQRPASLGSYIIKQAQQRFAEVMGLEMKEIELKAHVNHGKGKSRLGGGSKTGNAYVLRSLLPSSIRENHVEAGNVQVEKGFTMVVFSLLSTNAGKISEGDLWAYLEDIGVRKGEMHDVFGCKPETLLETMEKQKYIYRSKAQGNDGGEVIEYYHGDNCVDEMKNEASIKGWIKEVLSYRRTQVQPSEVDVEAY